MLEIIAFTIAETNRLGELSVKRSDKKKLV